MLFAVFCYSSISLAIALVGGNENPFLFGMGWRIGIAMGFALYLPARYPHYFFNKRAWSVLRDGLKSWSMCMTVMAYFDVVFFAISTIFIPIPVATILVQFSPIIFAFMMQRLDRDDRGYTPLTPTTVLLMGIGLAGFALVLAAQQDLSELTIDGSIWLVGIGVIFVFAAAIVGALNAYNFSLGGELARKYISESKGTELVANEGHRDDLQLFYVVMCSLFANLIAAGITGVLGLGSVRLGILPVIKMDVIFLSIIWGAVAYSTAGLAHRKAMLMTHNLGINALSYARPIFGIVLLFLFADHAIELERLDLFILGAAAIIGANLLINSEGKRLIG